MYEADREYSKTDEEWRGNTITTFSNNIVPIKEEKVQTATDKTKSRRNICFYL